jgi:hypothetical protein
MNGQNILNYYGTRLNVRVDNSEFHDYQISKVYDDFNTDVLDLSNPITYSTLKIDTNFEGYSILKTTITLDEFDNTVNDGSYIYSGLTFTFDYDTFTANFDTTVQYSTIQLNNDVYTFTGITGEIHYFTITAYNEIVYNPMIFSGFTEAQVVAKFSPNIISCVAKLSNPSNCCPLDDSLNVLPWVYQINHGAGMDNCEYSVRRRTEAGWTLDFIFNRQGLNWSDGSVFYYLGVRGEDNLANYADNNLSFQFTPDGRIMWAAIHYSGYCVADTTSDLVNNPLVSNPYAVIMSGATEEDNRTVGYQESYYIISGQTPVLCTTDSHKDFNVTITFDRYKHYVDCEIANDGGWNDMINDPIVQNPYAVVMSGATEIDAYTEKLAKKWANERDRRLGTLKIYLNGRPIYKLENFEEVIPSIRGTQSMIQSWGGGTNLMGEIHDGICQFIIKSAKYYEEPLDFPHVYHDFKLRENQYDFAMCGPNCIDDPINLNSGHIKDEDSSFLATDDDFGILFRT